MPNVAGLLQQFLLLAIAINLVVFGLPALWLAGEKGRNPLVWAAVALFIGPLAVLTVGLSPRAAGGPFGECSSCCEIIRLDAQVCPFCRTRFATAAVDSDWDPMLTSRMASPGS